MLTAYKFPKYPYCQSPEQEGGFILRHPVVIVGAGPVGLAAAIDFSKRGIRTVLLDDNDTVSVGSRAVCHAKRTLEIFDRLGCAAPLLEKGVSWKTGKVFFQDQLRYSFDLLPEDGHKMPAMINLQQYYLEECLIEQASKQRLCQLRWKHKVIGVEQHEDHAVLAVETPDGVFNMEAGWVIACDGANSSIRNMVGAQFDGQVFHDRFLIADVVMKADFPAERWFWFDPPFHPNQSALLHKQADNVWRIDFQLGQDADLDGEKRPERVIPRVRAMLGEDCEFELEWVSIYQFACRRIDNFRHGRVIFAGDSAHQVSPFGARGGNSGIQDIDNLGWKLKLVMDGHAPDALLETYHQERAFAADDNILHSARSTDFITPKTQMSKRFRNAVLDLSASHPFARPLVNSGRLSTPTPYVHSPLNSPDEIEFDGGIHPGTNCADAPIRINGQDGWFLNQTGDGFVLLVFGEDLGLRRVESGKTAARVLVAGSGMEDSQGLLAARYGARPGTVYLIRPDQHVAARWRSFDLPQVRKALDRAVAA